MIYKIMSNYELVSELRSWVKEKRLVINNIDSILVIECARNMPGVALMYSEPYDANVKIILDEENIFPVIQELHSAAEAIVNSMYHSKKVTINLKRIAVENILCAIETLLL